MEGSLPGGMGSKLHLVWSCIGEGSRGRGSKENPEGLHAHGPAPGKGQAGAFVTPSDVLVKTVGSDGSISQTWPTLKLAPRVAGQ